MCVLIVRDPFGQGGPVVSAMVMSAMVIDGIVSDVGINHKLSSFLFGEFGLAGLLLSVVE
jgi:hypothetical protein